MGKCDCMLMIFVFAWCSLHKHVRKSAVIPEYFVALTPYDGTAARVLQVVYSALTHFWNVAVGIAPVWLELQISHSMRNLVKSRRKNSGLKIFDNDDPTGPWLKMADSYPPSLAKMLSLYFFSFFVRVSTEFTNGNFSESRTMKELQNLTLLSYLVLPHVLKKKFWNLFWKCWSFLIFDPVCAHN